jgi:cysteine desulfurase
MDRRVYLDYAAATPMSDVVLRAMQPFFQEQFYNPSALYKEAVAVHKALEDARSLVARSIGARPSEILFTAGGTESTNLAIHGVMNANPNKTLLISAIEHDAVRYPAAEYDHKELSVDANGSVSVASLASEVAEDTVLVSIILANNEIGTIQPIAEIASVLQEIRVSRAKIGNQTPLYLHVDACQAPLYLDVNVARLGFDLMTLNGGKMYGPKQSGILFVKTGAILKPLISGGGQEFGMRSGTENVAQAVGFSVALKNAQKNRTERSKQVQELRDYFINELEERFSARLNGHKQKRLANNVHVTFPGIDNERVLFAFDELGVAAAAGSACSASKEEASHVLRAIGLSEDDARSSVRFSLSEFTTKEEIQFVLEQLPKALSA